ncbi:MULTISPECIES: hypothetical protein [unclassified Pseudoxanthomonas]|uniref:hypothetical protein n=1 Tax=unclassified Pseudoxanthomonas TaxID=2645906 RepID=UPI0008EF5A2C|nr:MULTISPECIES: hypothetical protein [unclassified Pseudoxanthomonas]SFV34495.1 hypothetical protein SAMN05428990_2748 [Pseudoxanthomonas sp. YR558]
MPISQDVTDSPMDADDAAPVAPTIQGIDDGPSPLEQALQALQSGPTQSLADPGITLLSPAQLDLLYMGARLQAEQCHDGVLLLLDLMHGAQSHGAQPDAALMQRFVEQLHHLCRDQQRWHALADNAAYYRDNRRVTDRIASWVRVQLPADASPG